MTTADLSDDLLRVEFARLEGVAGVGEDCPTAEVLWLSGRAELEATHNEVVLDHLGRCPACASGWRLAQDMAEDSLRRMQPVSIGRSRWMRSVPLLAAAVLAVTVSGVGIVQWYRQYNAPPRYRAVQGEWLQPGIAEGSTVPRERFILRWAEGPEGTTFDVRVSTERLDHIARGMRIREAEFQVPPEKLEALSPGAPVFWQVTARMPDGAIVESRSFMVVLE